jgi:hypothetical protein
MNKFARIFCRHRIVANDRKRPALNCNSPNLQRTASEQHHFFQMQLKDART